MRQRVPISSSPTKRLRILYIMALSMIAILAIAGQWLIQRTLSSIEQDARIVNVAGRQRMLSQRISRTILEISMLDSSLQSSRTALENSTSLEKKLTLRHDLEEWSQSHDRLRSDPVNSNPTLLKTQSIERIFLDIETDYATIKTAAQSYANDRQRSIDPQEVIERSDRFLFGMDQIVGLYERDARERVSRLEGIERLLLVITLGVLVCEGAFIFTPSIRSLQRSFNRLEKTQSELIAAKEQADMANRSKSDFLTRVSHELRTPLHAILGMLCLIRRKDLSTDNSQRIRIAKQATRHLNRLVDDLLDVSAIETGRALQISKDRVAIGRVIDSVAALMQPAASMKGLDLQCDVAQDLPERCILDRIRIQQILLNLLQNAIRYTNQGFVKLECFFTASNSPSTTLSGESFGTISIRVTDSGLGISAENQRRIFRTFETINEEQYKAAATSASKELGTSLGLGLSVVASLVEALDGTLSLSSEVGIGTTISIQLPTIVCPKQRNRLRKQRASTHHRSSPNEEPSVDRNAMAFILDDSKANRLLMRAYLRRLGFQCRSFSNADLLIASCKTNPPDWIFMDWQLRGMGGDRLLEELLEIDSHPRVVVVTADLNALDAIRLHSYKVLGCLFKPLEFRHFKREIERLVDRSQSSRVPAPVGKSTDGDNEWSFLQQKLRRLVNQQFPKDLLEMRNLVLQGNWNQLQLIAHRIHGSAGNARLDKLSELMGRLEATCLNKDTQRSNLLLDQADEWINPATQTNRE